MPESHEDISQLLASVGADVNHLAVGIDKYFRCPKCSHTRTGNNKKVKCLSIKADGDGFVFKCHHCGWSGGSRNSKDNGSSNGRGSRRSRSADGPKPAASAKREDAKARLREALANHDRARATAAPERKIAATYDYKTADGTLVYQKIRYIPKSFSQRRPDGNGGWIWKLGDETPRVLYRLPELIEDSAATVFILEGEKDADRVATLGLCTTSADGGNWKTPDLIEPLCGRDVVIVADFDEAGVERAKEVRDVLHGTAASIKLILLPGLDGTEGNNDASDWLNRAPARADIFAEISLKAPLWTPDTPDSEVPGMEAAKRVKAKKEAPTEALAAATVLEPLPFIDLSKWSIDNAPPREWAVRDLIPPRNVFLLSGEGAAGKTLLVLQLGIAHALGRDWIGTLPEAGPFLYLGAEDDEGELYRRLADILNHYGADFPDLEDRVHLLSYVGEDAVLGYADRSGRITPTTLYERLYKAAVEIKPVMICIDTVADVFAGSEIDRSEVRQFVGLLRKLAIQANCYVAVISHPSLTGISSGSGLSGSTGWHNSVRARAYLKSVKIDDEDESDPNLRTLEFKKNNYGPVSRSIMLRWENGVYKPVSSASSFDKLAAEARADRLFLTLLDRFNRQNRNVNDKPAAKNFAPSAFANEAEAKKDGVRKADFENAMRRLFAAEKISIVPYGARCRGTTRLVTL